MVVERNNLESAEKSQSAIHQTQRWIEKSKFQLKVTKSVHVHFTKRIHKIPMNINFETSELGIIQQYFFITKTAIKFRSLFDFSERH